MPSDPDLSAGGSVGGQWRSGACGCDLPNLKSHATPQTQKCRAADRKSIPPILAILPPVFGNEVTPFIQDPENGRTILRRIGIAANGTA
jgi:hypothetical protein